MNKVSVKKENKYVIATLGNPTLYLMKIAGKNEYYFTDDIVVATKTTSRKIATDVLTYYYLDTGNEDVELVIIPLEINYSLVDER